MAEVDSGGEFDAQMIVFSGESSSWKNFGAQMEQKGSDLPPRLLRWAGTPQTWSSP